MKKYYNYAIADEYKSKLAIPYTSIEFSGWLSFFGYLILLITIVFVVGIPLSFILGSMGYFIAVGIAFTVATFIINIHDEINNETGKTKATEFYYVKIKRYRLVYDRFGEKHYLQRKKKGVLYLACR